MDRIQAGQGGSGMPERNDTVNGDRDRDRDLRAGNSAAIPNPRDAEDHRSPFVGAGDVFRISTFLVAESRGPESENAGPKISWTPSRE